MESTPARDFTIPSGEKLSLKLKVPTGKSSAKQGDDAHDDDDGGGFASSASQSAASAAASKPIKLVALAPPMAAPKGVTFMPTLAIDNCCVGLLTHCRLDSFSRMYSLAIP